MSGQPELFVPSLTLRPPDGASGPRLWVRRLTIWREPGGDIVRDIALRPGLNIVWSPDGGGPEASQAHDGAMGHGSGKTLYCRLLRYCLGEDRYAPENQRDQIVVAFPNGIVGAEVMLDGVPWSILRPLGRLRRHMAVMDGDLDQIAGGEGTHTGLDPLLDAIEQRIMTPAVADLVPGHRQDRRTWPIALAWLARDQECRLSDALDWRATVSDSESPALGLNKTDRLVALRAFLGAMTVEERNHRRGISALEDQKTKLDKDIDHRTWQIDRMRTSLAHDLEVQDDGLVELPLALELFRRAAVDRFASIDGSAPEQAQSDIATVRRSYDAARDESERISNIISTLAAQIAEIPKSISRIQGEINALSFDSAKAENPLCPICGVPIDHVLAAGCHLSQDTANLETCRQRLESRRADRETEEKRFQDARDGRQRALAAHALALQKTEALSNQLRSLDLANNTHRERWFAARRLVERADRLSNLMELQGSDQRNLRDLTARIEAARAVSSSLRDSQRLILARLNEKFAAIIRFIVGEAGKGRIALDGNGFRLIAEIGGDRRTAAIESLKVLAFDLAALCLSVQAETNVPAFLIHDSPREADLGLPLYHRLFEFVRSLEEACGETPLFQYIVTTTTIPPSELNRKPWLISTLRGAPANERLMRCDL
jgi:hypothetical protein